MVISWNTKKVKGGYWAQITSIEYGKPLEVVKIIGLCKTRAIATNQAKKWARYYKAH